MLTINNFTNNLKGLATINSHTIFGIACSGGLDSIVLAHIMLAAGANIKLLHCNFKLRAASNNDEQFVKHFAAIHNIGIEVAIFDTANYAATNKLSTQEAARKLRYDWFLKILKAENADKVYLCTAHHKDDNVETLLFNFLRGAGIKNMQGIPENYVLNGIPIIRPMLPFAKNDILIYAQENKLNWVEDESNNSTKYDRNFLRINILPKIYERNINAKDQILGNVQRFRQYENANNYHAAHVAKLILFNKIGKQVLINQQALPIKKIQQLGLNYCFACIEVLGFTNAQLPEIDKLFTSTNGKYLKAANNNYAFYKYNNWLLYKPFAINSQTIATHLIINKNDTNINAAALNLGINIITKDTAIVNNNKNEAFLNADLITWPLILRPCKEGDYFYPLGMQKKKKLSRFFIDEKIPVNKRNAILVLETDNKIIWVVGMRINDKFKITNATKQVLHLRVV